MAPSTSPIAPGRAYGTRPTHARRWRIDDRSKGGGLWNAALAESLSLHPGDQVTRYRQARLLETQKQVPAALDLYESVISAGAATPPTFYAAACMDAARLHEQQRDEPRAIELYRMAHETIGADSRTHDAAARALTRLASAASDASR
jgi:tetratricopeptide (TPR) repeat protein